MPLKKRKTNVMPVEKRTNNYSDSIRKAAEELGLSKPVKTNSSQIEQIFTGWANVVKDRFNIYKERGR